MIRKSIFIVLLLLAPLQLLAQREVHLFNDSWNFSYLWQSTSSSTANLPRVNIPHTWNLDAISARADYHRGAADYIKEFTAPMRWQEQAMQVYLRFGAVNTNCEVYLNGIRLGEHRGGYTAFGFNITPHLNYTRSNRLWVRVSNAQQESVMPLAGDFNHYGGIFRDVEVIATPRVHFSHTDYATSGIKIIQRNVSEKTAAFDIEYEVAGGAGSEAQVSLKIFDGAGVAVDSTTKRVTIGLEQKKTEVWKVSMKNPQLWNGVLDPHLYRVEAKVSSQAQTSTGSSAKKMMQTDSITENFGLRFFEIDDSNQFLLNGKPYPLRGVVRLEDVALLGNAIYAEQQDKDMELMLDMGVTAVRLAYYPQNPYFIELCDREGIVVWAEIPLSGPTMTNLTGFNNSDAFKENGIQQLTELIEQNYNNPSILFWGLFSGLSQRNGNPLNYIKELNTLAKELDPTRYTVAASNQDGEMNFVSELIGFNQYMGWLSGMPGDIEAWGQAVRDEFPELKVALSEYGAGASPYQHEIDPQKPVVNSYWHPEEWQSKVHEDYIKVIEQKKYFWGTFLSAMFDWGVASLRQGTRAGVSDLGLVSFDRQTTKDAYWLYKANWNKDDSFVYITSRRFKIRHELTQDIKIYTSSKEVILTVNGKELEPVANDGFGVALFEDCELKEGQNVVEAFSPYGDYDRITFEVRLNQLEKPRRLETITAL